MAPEAPAPHDARTVGVSSWIARERVAPESPPRWWIGALGGLAVLTFAALAALATTPAERVAGEETYGATDGFLQALQAFSEPSQARLWSAVSGAVLVAATGIATRRLLHHDLAALFAAALVAIDPAALVHGRLATPVAPSSAAAMLALALFLAPDGQRHWWASGLFAFAAFLDPAHMLWAPALAVLLLVRGHIYAAPQHAMTVGLQAVLVPGIGALLGLTGASSLTDGCFQPGRLDGLLVRHAIDLGGLHAAPNPVTWFAGMGALAYLALLAVTNVLSTFRIQRLPGRIQARLPDPMPRMHGRALWIALLALFAPTPLLWVPIFAIALAAGVQELGRDAAAFGIVVAIALLVFAAVATGQAWDLIMGQDNTAMLPWTRVAGC